MNYELIKGANLHRVAPYILLRGPNYLTLFNQNFNNMNFTSSSVLLIDVCAHHGLHCKMYLDRISYAFLISLLQR